MTGMVIHFNGFAGVGKLTTARALCERLNGRLIDNHSIINAARVPWPHGTKEYLDLLNRLRAEIYIDLAKQSPDEVQVFTNYMAAELAEDVQTVQDVNDLAKRRGVPFVPILLECDKAVNLERMQSPDRALKEKLRQPEVMEDHMAKYTIYHPEEEPYALRLDITHSTPTQSADAIVGHLKLKGLWP